MVFLFYFFFFRVLNLNLTIYKLVFCFEADIWNRIEILSSFKLNIKIRSTAQNKGSLILSCAGQISFWMCVIVEVNLQIHFGLIIVIIGEKNLTVIHFTK